MDTKTAAKKTFRGELALVVAVLVNSFSVVLMLYSGAGISAISSVPYAFSEVFPVLTLGTWTYLFQGVLVLSLGAPAAVCALLSLQLCSGLCVWRTAGYPRGLDRPSSHGAAI